MTSLYSTESGTSEDCFLQVVGSDSSDEDNITLAKLASNNWSDSDCDVPLSKLCQKETKSEEQETDWSTTQATHRATQTSFNSKMCILHDFEKLKEC